MVQVCVAARGDMCLIHIVGVVCLEYSMFQGSGTNLWLIIQFQRPVETSGGAMTCNATILSVIVISRATSTKNLHLSVPFVLDLTCVASYEEPPNCHVKAQMVALARIICPHPKPAAQTCKRGLHPFIRISTNAVRWGY